MLHSLSTADLALALKDAEKKQLALNKCMEEQAAERQKQLQQKKPAGSVTPSKRRRTEKGAVGPVDVVVTDTEQPVHAGELSDSDPDL